MTNQLPTPQRLFSFLAAVITFNLGVNPTFAADPFRTSNQHRIGDKTEAAFQAIFRDGNYPAADRYLQQAITSEPNEPLAYAMRASLAYASKDLSSLDTYANKTLETAQKLTATDPLRGNLYTAVGHFLVGATTLKNKGTVNGTADALNRLRQVYEYIDKAEAITPNDPEVNLLKGYMDLMLAVNLPFSNPDEAIQRLKTAAGPQYLAERGVAIGYRDLKQYDQALTAVNQALKTTANNPELYYLKGQILKAQGKNQRNPGLLREALNNFDQAIAKKSQLPENLVKQMERERRTLVEVLAKPM